MSDVTWGWQKSMCCLWGIVVLWSIGASGASLPPDRDNAALLYYQAFLRLPEPDETEERLINSDKPDRTYQYLQSNRERTIRNYIRVCDETVKLAQEASELSQCNWGIQHSKGIAAPLPLIDIRNLSFVLQTDALISATDGDYRAAFERCLMMRRFARQIGDDVRMLYAVSTGTDRMALGSIQTILGTMEPDAETLVWLKQRLAEESRPPFHPARNLRIDFAHVLQSLRNDKARLDEVRQAMRWKGQIRAFMEQNPAQGLASIEAGPNGQLLTDEDREELTAIIASFKEQDANVEGDHDPNDLTDEELVALAAKPYAAFLEGAIAVMEGNLSYEEKIAELKRLEEDIRNEYGNNRPAQRRMLTSPERTLGFAIVMASRTDVADAYELSVRHRAHINVVTAAIEVYLVNAREGHLPETLVPGLPKDPYTGRDFAYEKTADGFRLSRPDTAYAPDSRTTYEFKVR